MANARADARRTKKAAKSPFEKARGIEMRYARQLRKVAAEIGRIIDGFPDPVENPGSVHAINEAMDRYSDLLTPWARSVAGRVVAELDAQDRQAWIKHSADMSRALRHEILSAPTGETARFMLAEQVELIRSLPLEAAKRVHELTLKGLEDGTRAKEIAAEIMRTGHVTKSRATLIARTEVARTANTLTMARSMHVGSTSYIWRTARDSDVRPSHRAMEGKSVEWAHPPTLSDGTTTHAGMIYNCRCYCEPIIPNF